MCMIVIVEAGAVCPYTLFILVLINHVRPPQPHTVGSREMFIRAV